MLTSDFLEGSSVADAPDYFRTACSENKTVARDLREEYEEVASNDLLVVCRACNETVTFDSLDFW